MSFDQSLNHSNLKHCAIQTIRKLLLEEDGQAIVEYLLAMSISLIIVSRLTGAIRDSLKNLWTSMANDIAPACPRCKLEGEEILKMR